MSSPSDGLADRATAVQSLRDRILATAQDPAQSPEDFEQVAAEARHALQTGELRRRQTSLRVRLFGIRVPEHEVPVHSAAVLLDALQSAVTATGEAVRRQNALPASSADAQRTTMDATALFLSPRIDAGSVIFFLEAKERTTPANADAALVIEDVDGLVDIAIDQLFRVLELAGAEDVQHRQALEESLRELGVRAASRIAGLAEASLREDIEMDLALRTPRGRRTSGLLSRRTSVALQHAFAQASDRVERAALTGILHTVSDGADPLRMEVESLKRDIRLVVAPEVGARLGPLLSQRIKADVEVTIKWHAASGKETRTYRLLDADRAPVTQTEIQPVDE